VSPRSTPGATSVAPETKRRRIVTCLPGQANLYRKSLTIRYVSNKSLFDLLFAIEYDLTVMNPTPKTDTVSFTVKGQVVIPRWLRKDFEINEGTRAVVYKQNDHIVLKPLTAQHYRRLRGSLKGTKAMEVFMSERKREREL
jgi:AbrB family looped-hinge helix DNA binding protein